VLFLCSCWADGYVDWFNWADKWCSCGGRCSVMFVGETEGVWQVTRKVIVQMYDKESVQPGPVGTVTLGVHTAHNFCPFLFHLSYFLLYRPWQVIIFALSSCQFLTFSCPSCNYIFWSLRVYSGFFFIIPYCSYLLFLHLRISEHFLWCVLYHILTLFALATEDGGSIFFVSGGTPLPDSSV